MSGLHEVMTQVRAVLDATRELQPSSVVFHHEYVPESVRHKSYRLVVGSIQSNRMLQADASGALCSEKRRLLSIFIAAKNPNNEQKVYEDLQRLEELIERNILRDPRTAAYIGALHSVETSPDRHNTTWIMEMAFDFEYTREF